MSFEPERPIEKLLRAGARQRRERAGEGWEIHPATRRLLQGEVARRYPQRDQSKPRRFGWLLGHGWTRPIGAFGAVAIVGALVWISFRSFQPSPKSEPLLAKNEEFRRSAAEPVAPAESPTPNAAPSQIAPLADQAKM